MQYIMIEFDNGERAYQEVLDGYVQRILDLNGSPVSDEGRGSSVVDAAPPRPEWAAGNEDA